MATDHSRALSEFVSGLWPRSMAPWPSGWTSAARLWPASSPGGWRRTASPGFPAYWTPSTAAIPGPVSDETHPEALSESLGSRYETLGGGYKLYSCVGTNFTALDAVKEILAAHPLAPDGVSSLVVRTSEYQNRPIRGHYRRCPRRYRPCRTAGSITPGRC